MAFVGIVLSARPSFAFGDAGCNLLPEHDRAISTIENGAYSCGMSMEEANQILGMKPRHDMTIEELIELPVVDDSRQILEDMLRPAGDLCRGSRFEDFEGEAWGTFLLRSGWVRYPADLSVLS